MNFPQMLKRAVMPWRWLSHTGRQLLLGFGPTDAGITVTPQTALGYDPVWRANQLISPDAAGITLDVFRRVGEERRGKEPDRLHPAFRVIRQPNDELTWRNFVLQMQTECNLEGQAFARIFRDGNQMVSRVEPRQAESTTVERLADGTLLYRMHSDRGAEELVSFDDVLHLRGIGMVGDEAESPVKRCRNAIALGMAAERYGAKFFANNARPGVVLVHPHSPDEAGKEELVRSWKEAFGAEGDLHGTAVTFEGMSPHIIPTPNNEEAQFLETLIFRVRVVANVFGVPAHKLGDPTRVGHASLEAEERSYLRNTLDPWLRMWESELMRKFLSPAERRSQSHIIEFNRRGIARATLAERTESYQKAVGGPWMTINEARAAENMNPMPGGDDIRQQMQMGPIAGDDNEADEPDDTDDNQEDDQERALAEILAQTIHRMMKRMKTHFDRDKDPFSDENWEVFKEAVSPIMAACGHDVDETTYYIWQEITRRFEQWDNTETLKELTSKWARRKLG